MNCQSWALTLHVTGLDVLVRVQRMVGRVEEEVQFQGERAHLQYAHVVPGPKGYVALTFLLVSYVNFIANLK